MTKQGVFQAVCEQAAGLSAPADSAALLARHDAESTVRRLARALALPDHDLVITLVALAVLRGRRAAEARGL